MNSRKVLFLITLLMTCLLVLGKQPCIAQQGQFLRGVCSALNDIQGGPYEESDPSDPCTGVGSILSQRVPPSAAQAQAVAPAILDGSLLERRLFQPTRVLLIEVGFSRLKSWDSCHAPEPEFEHNGRQI